MKEQGRAKVCLRFRAWSLLIHTRLFSASARKYMRSACPSLGNLVFGGNSTS